MLETLVDIRDRYADGSWEVFNMFLQQTPPLNVGFHRYVLDNFTGDSMDGVIEHEVEEFDPPSEVSGLRFER